MIESTNQLTQARDHKPARSSRPGLLSDKRKVGLNALLGILSLLFFFVGIQKVAAMQPMMTNMEELGYNTPATMAIGWLEVAAVAGLWWRPTRLLSLTGLLLVISGAAGSHISAGDPVVQVIPLAGISLAIIGAAFADQGRHLADFLRGHARPIVG